MKRGVRPGLSADASTGVMANGYSMDAVRLLASIIKTKSLEAKNFPAALMYVKPAMHQV
jgi:hypothetical protein